MALKISKTNWPIKSPFSQVSCQSKRPLQSEGWIPEPIIRSWGQLCVCGVRSRWDGEQPSDCCGPECVLCIPESLPPPQTKKYLPLSHYPPTLCYLHLIVHWLWISVVGFGSLPFPFHILNNFLKTKVHRPKTKTPFIFETLIMITNLISDEGLPETETVSESDRIHEIGKIDDLHHHHQERERELRRAIEDAGEKRLCGKGPSAICSQHVLIYFRIFQHTNSTILNLYLSTNNYHNLLPTYPPLSSVLLVHLWMCVCVCAVQEVASIIHYSIFLLPDRNIDQTKPYSKRKCCCNPIHFLEDMHCRHAWSVFEGRLSSIKYFLNLICILFGVS